MSRSIPYVDVTCNRCRKVVLKVSFTPHLDIGDQLREDGWEVGLKWGELCPRCIEEEDVISSGGGVDE